MKKIFTLILILAAVSAFGQSLTLGYEGTAINDGDTLEIVVPQLNVTHTVWLDLSNISSEDVTVRVYKRELDMVSDASASLCFGNICFPPTSSSSGTLVLEANSTLSYPDENAFHLNYKTQTAGISYVEFTFTNEDDEDDNVSMVFKLVYDPANIASTVTATRMRAYPNPATDNVTVEYAVSSNVGKAQLVIKNMLGATLYTKNIDVNANKAKVDVSEYPAGIYFYSIETDGRPLVTKKLLVK